jgi:putative sterol carrier protein
MSSASTIEKHMQAMAEGFQSSKARRLKVVYEFRLTGEGGGTWTISVADGKCDVDQGTPPRADTTVTMNTDQYLKLAAGKLDSFSRPGPHA